MAAVDAADPFEAAYWHELSGEWKFQWDDLIQRLGPEAKTTLESVLTQQRRERRRR
jgi:hypothetical protein